jgi:hypothetical protein
MTMIIRTAAVIAFLSNVGLMVPAHSQDNTADNMSEGFALVELFTSQGCSSCPAADANLISIANEARQSGKQVLTLSFHVDYWNDLGWKDPYSLTEATRRQRLYAQVLGTDQVYTPQMIVNGTKEFVGSRPEKSNPAIQAALRTPATAEIDVASRLENGKLIVKWKAKGMQPTDLINVALVQNLAEENVSAGENSGRKLQHVNVVRQLNVVSATSSDQVISFDVPDPFKPSDFHVVGYIQSQNDAVIRAAKSTQIDG